MDSELERVIRTDVKPLRGLRKLLGSKTRQYFLTSDKDGCNIFHHSVRSHASTLLIKELVQRLPKQDVQRLVSQQSTLTKWNALHLAALWSNNLDTVDLLLSVYRSSSLSLPSSSSTSSSGYVVEQNPLGGKPWLARAQDGRTPLHMFLEHNKEEFALEILSMDMKLLSRTVDHNGNSPLYHAVNRGFNKFALKILKSKYSFSVSGQNGFQLLHVMARCSEVGKLLYKKNPQFLHLTSENQTSLLHEWAKEATSRMLVLLEETIGVNSLNALSRLKNIIGDIPLHTAIKHDNQEFAICLAEKCGLQSNPPLWQFENVCGVTPLDLALDKCWESLVLYFISNYSWSYKEPNYRWKRRLVVAFENHMGQLAERICNHVDIVLIVGDLFSEPSTSSQSFSGQTILYILSHCKEEVWRVLHSKHPDIIHVTGENGTSVLHEWAKKGELWPLHLLDEVDIKSLEKLSRLVNDDGDTPLHVAIKHYNEAFSLCLVERCRMQDPPLWRYENKDGIMPVDLALHHNFENLVLHFISRDSWTYKKRSNKGETRLFLAVEKGMDQVVQTICEFVGADYTQSVIPTESHDGRTLIYVLTSCTEMTANLLFKTFPNLINKPDQNGKRPIDIASEFGDGWLTKLLITNDPSTIAISPNVWIELCKRGHSEAIEAFIKHYDDFRQLCIEQEDSPLHRIKLTTYQEYDRFLAMPMIWEMRNRRDYDGKTPLHRALEREDLLYAEILLQKGVNRSIRDKRRKTATKLLADLCDRYLEWEEMVQRVGINPRLRNLGPSAGEMRTTLSVVAALLATLTFAAAFTVPGGFDQSTGEVLLVKKATFLVFILADTYTMCCAMFVLFCLIWSMVCDEDESKLLIDRSVLVLIQSFYGTLVAFMTGVFTVIYHKSLWAAILICVMCSLVAISTNRSILFRVLDKLDKKDEAQSKMKIWEQVEVKITRRKGFWSKRRTARGEYSDRCDPLANV